MPVALLLLTLTIVCAVGPVAINMAALQLKAKAVEMDSIQQELEVQVRDVEAQIATLNSTAHLQEEVEKLGMASASSFSYLDSAGSSGGEARTASSSAAAEGTAEAGATPTDAAQSGAAESLAQEGGSVGAAAEAGVAWLEADGGSGGSGSNTILNR